ncbi:hypothetical protein Bbelb_400530 [Branchiostoma belcheri]|nr:hypothetical protein Bbelb_400530 [Branchiostoma belcheri]
MDLLDIYRVPPWGPDPYFYPIQIAQFGLSHFSKNLTEKEPRVTVFERGDGQVGTRWDVPGKQAQVESVTDKGCSCRVLQFHTGENNLNTPVPVVWTVTSISTVFPAQFFLSQSGSTALSLAPSPINFINLPSDRLTDKRASRPPVDLPLLWALCEFITNISPQPAGM